MAATDDRLMLRFLLAGGCCAERLGGPTDGQAAFGVFEGEQWTIDAEERGKDVRWITSDLTQDQEGVPVLTAAARAALLRELS